MRFGVLREVSINIIVFWNIILGRQVLMFQRNLLPLSSAWREAASSERFVPTYQDTWHCIPEDSHLQCHTRLTQLSEENVSLLWTGQVHTRHFPWEIHFIIDHVFYITIISTKIFWAEKWMHYMLKYSTFLNKVKLKIHN